MKIIALLSSESFLYHSKLHLSSVIKTDVFLDAFGFVSSLFHFNL